MEPLVHGLFLRETLDFLLVPLSVVAGCILKRREMAEPGQLVVYVIFSLLMGFTLPDFIFDVIPSLAQSSSRFLSIVSAIYGGLIVMNLWRLLGSRGFWDRLVAFFLRTPS